MGAFADQVDLVMGFDPECDPVALDRNYPYRGPNFHADRGRRHMAHFEMDAKALMAIGQQVLDRIRKLSVPEVLDASFSYRELQEKTDEDLWSLLEDLERATQRLDSEEPDGEEEG